MSEAMNTTVDLYNDIPLVALRGLVIFPKSIITFEVGRQKSVTALEEAIADKSLIFVAAQCDATTSEPEQSDIYSFGTIVRVFQSIKLPGNILRVVVEGVARARVLDYVKTEPYYRVSAEVCAPPDSQSNIIDVALMRSAYDIFEVYAKLTGRITPDVIMSIVSCDDPGMLADLMTSNSQINFAEKQLVLQELDIQRRLILTMELLYKEVEILTLQEKISTKVKESIDKTQRQYYLREQLKVINDELGTDDGIQGEIKAYRSQMEAKIFPESVKDKLERELRRLSRSSSSSGEASVIRDYIECILELPWTEASMESLDLKKAQKVLDKEHYGLEMVKERITEFLAVRQTAETLDAPIICLVGPPGIGKTSIAKSIAGALNRKYVRISLGGVRDEAEIRGHRKTYVGAMPGRIVSAMRQAGTTNPLILLDEVDKISADYKGDPSSALLEVLDGEQNKFFRDHYLELPYDLSNVLFMCTANAMDTVQKALKDRLEVIQLSSYTSEEKRRIASEFLVSKQLKKHGLKSSQLKIRSEAINDIILYYTKEAGVRELERLIGQICRKAVKTVVMEQKKSVTVTSVNLEKYLGKRKYRHDKINEKPEIGICKGLAWTVFGGEILSIEVNIMKGTGKFELTGNMGIVMKESAMAAVSYIKSKQDDFGLPKNLQKGIDIHIHIPEGAVPKDGPSAGVTMATAMISAFTQVPVRNDVGMTGEITIRGKVLPIGSLKEKVLAAKNAGLKKIIIPIDNKADLDELPDYIKEGLNIYLASDISEVLDIALYREEAQK